LPRRDPAQAPKGPAARSATEALLDGLDSASREYSISSTSHKSQPSRASRKSPLPRRSRGRPPLGPDEKSDHVKTTFSLPPDTIALIERLRTAPELFTAGVPSKSDVVTEAVRRLAVALEQKVARSTRS
jgi:hypothetical protein